MRTDGDEQWLTNYSEKFRKSTNLDKADAFYGKLLDDPGRRIPYASRHYIDCGPVILDLVDSTPGGEEAKPVPDKIYFAVGDLDTVYARATELRCLSSDDAHGASAGEIVVRPWGERSRRHSF